MNRRNFIKGIAGLAAIAVSPNTLALLLKTDRQRLEEAIYCNRIIDRQTFYLENDGPIILDGVSNLTITNCQFIFKNRQSQPVLEIRLNCRNLNISFCEFIYENDAKLPVSMLVEYRKDLYV